MSDVRQWAGTDEEFEHERMKLKSDIANNRFRMDDYLYIYDELNAVIEAAEGLKRIIRGRWEKGAAS